VTIQEFIALLANFESFEGTRHFQSDELGRLYLLPGPDKGEWAALVDTAETEACGHLMDNKWRPSWSAHLALEKAGFRVYAGETDSFGWLTGCVDVKIPEHAGQDVATLVFG
jgi:hypothetical protein